MAKVKEYVNSKKIIDILGGEERINQVAINPAISFVSGKITSSFNAVQNSKTDYIVLEIFNHTGGEDKLIKRISFSKKDKCEEYKNEDKKEKYADYKDTYLKNNPNASENEIKDEFEKTFIYKISEDQSSIYNNLANIGLTGYGTYNSVNELSNNPEIITEMATTLSSEITNLIISESTKLATSSVTKITTHMLLGPQLVQKYAKEEFNRKKLQLSDLLKRFQDTIENQLKEYQTNSESTAEKDQKKKISKILSDIQGYVGKVTKDSSIALDKVSKYIVEGPDTLASFVNNTVNEYVGKASDFINDRVDEGIKQYDLACKSRGEKIGQKMADEYNSILEKKAKKMEADIKTKTSEAFIKVFAAKQKASLKIMAMTGINIPI